MGFQKGDQQIFIVGKTYDLRLTMGALAAISSRLEAAGPKELSARLRHLSAAQGRMLLACVMRPCFLSETCPEGLAARFSDSEIAEAMPIICCLFEEAFKHDA